MPEKYRTPKAKEPGDGLLTIGFVALGVAIAIFLGSLLIDTESSLRNGDSGPVRLQSYLMAFAQLLAPAASVLIAAGAIVRQLSRR